MRSGCHCARACRWWSTNCRIRLARTYQGHRFGQTDQPEDVAWALCMGADFVTSARGFMFALGCIQALQCNREHMPYRHHHARCRCNAASTRRKGRARRRLCAQTWSTRWVSSRTPAGCVHPANSNRSHARIVQDNGLSIGLHQLHLTLAGARRWLPAGRRNRVRLRCQSVTPS